MMKLPALLHALFNGLQKVFGHWQPAPWMTTLAAALKAHARWLLLGSAVLAAAVFGWIYAKNNWLGLTPDTTPKSAVRVTVTAPGRTVIEADALAERLPKPVVVGFSASVAPLALIGKDAADIRLSPDKAGVWQWESATRLVFTPKEDWPIGQAYQLSIGSKAIAPHIEIDRRTFDFSSAAFTARIDSAQFYQDPTQPNVRRAVYQLGFSHPVHSAALEKALSLSFKADCSSGLLGGLAGFGLGQCDSEKFSLTLDQFKLNATVQSQPLPIPKDTQAMFLRLPKDFTAAKGGKGLASELAKAVEIPSLYSLAVSQVQADIVTGESGEPEHVLHVSTSMAVHEREMSKQVQAWLLPEKANPKDEEATEWEGNPGAISDAVLKRSTVVKLEPIAGEREVVESVSFKMPQAQGGKYLLVRVAKGIKTPGGYTMGNARQDIILLKTFAPELSIMSKGSLLALSGERKLPVLVRDLPGITTEIGRVLPQQLQHLITQSQGDFSNPEFMGRFDADNLSERYEQNIPLSLQAGKTHYETVDFGKYLKSDEKDGKDSKDGKDKRGIFLLTVKAYDPEANEKNKAAQAAQTAQATLSRRDNAEGEGSEGSDQGEGDERQQAMSKQDRRLILVTDLGMVVKKSMDGTRDVFVQSIATGKPVDGAVVEVWGRNGSVVMSQTTSATGAAKLAGFANFTRERSPVVMVVRKAGDMSFMPLNRNDRQLDMSRFDVGGVRSAGVPNQMSAYLFSDRGIYRPGDTMNIGIIVKSGNWGAGLKDLPVEAEVIDARGLRVRREKLRLGAGGAAELSHTTQDTSPTGSYTVQLYLPKEAPAGTEPQGLLLGSTTVKVQAFMPDRTKVTAQMSAPPAAGWIKPSALKALVNVQNLFGTPAPNRRVDGQLTLTPAYPSFKGYSDYAFYDARRAKDKQSDELGTVQSNDKGDAEFDLRLERFVAATYQVHFLAKAFEPEGGRSVSAETSTMVSDLAHLVGVKTDGDTSYINKGAVQNASIIAINPQTQKIALGGLKLERLERKVLSVLVKQSNGLYRYESRPKERVIETKPYAIAAGGNTLALNTAMPGNFSYVLRDEAGMELNRVDYTVAGTANVSRSLDRNAELQLSLNKKDYVPGEDIEINVRAPYVGAGLITIERDKVYSHTWFKTDKTASVQKITLPKDFEGTGYVTVHFVRDLASDEIYMSPLSYGSVPFATSLAKRTANVQLTSSELIKPGQAVKIKITSDAPTKAFVYAVDEGILQVARYKTPDPLAHFFQKRALEVGTAQTLDLILPEFKKLMRGAAPGGDAEGELGKHLNPFKRKRDKPVAFWSGMVDVNGTKELSFDVPESYNGSLRVMVVAVNDEAAVAKSSKTVVRGDMVILPNIPTSLAPGDSVEVGVGLANNILKSGKDVPIALNIETTGGIEIVGQPTQTLSISERSEGSTRYQIRAKSGASGTAPTQLGSGSVIFTAQYKTYSARLATDVSIRPASPYVTLVQAGAFQGGGELQSQADLYPNLRKSDIAVSAAPWAFSVGLIRYLEAYPHGCTEQITSQTFPSVLLSNRPELYSELLRDKAKSAPNGMNSTHPASSGEKDAKLAAEQTLARYITQLRGRQSPEGGIGLWPGAASDAFATAYAVQLLVEAKDRKLNAPVDVLQKANGYLQSLLGGNMASPYDWRVRAQAAYVLTRQGIIVPAALANLREAARGKPWSTDLGAVYLAASYQLVKQDTVANEILQPVWAELLERSAKNTKRSTFDTYYDPIVHDAMALYVVSKHFPQRLKSVPTAAWTQLAAQLKEGWYNSLSSASMLMAIDAYFQTVSQNAAGKVAVNAIEHNGKATALAVGALNPLSRMAVPVGTTALKLSNGADFPLYYSWAEQGFERNVPTTAVAQGMEIIHEVLDASGKVVTQATLGQALQVRVRVRSVGKTAVNNVAVVDVLPSGLEPVLASFSDDANAAAPINQSNNQPAWQRRMGATGNWRVDYADVREDRVVFYGSVDTTLTEMIYLVRATNVGEFITPAAYGEAMYDRRVFARSAGGKFTVVK